jgi:peptide deformylase
MLTIIKTGDPKLTAPCKEIPIRQIQNGDYKTLIIDMHEILREAPAVGLAGPQIGVSEQLIVIEDTEERMRTIPRSIRNARQRSPFPFTVMFNPIIRDRSEKTATFFEGCLSVPNILGAVRRSTRVRVQYLNHNGEELFVWFEGWQARIIQHEIDHLNGIEFTDIALQVSLMSLDMFLAHWKEASSLQIEEAFGMQKGNSK